MTQKFIYGNCKIMKDGEVVLPDEIFNMMLEVIQAKNEHCSGEFYEEVLDGWSIVPKEKK